MASEAAGIIGLILGLGLFIGVVVAAVVIIPHWRIFQRAGYSGALGLLMILPLVNLIVLLWFAFADWPVLQARAEQEATPERRFGR